MASEIVKRYYFQKGELLESLKDDEVLEKALDVLGDQELYNKTLSTPEKGDSNRLKTTLSRLPEVEILLMCLIKL